MADPIQVSAEVTVPASALTFRATRSAGPGGQNVNKVASKVELRVELDRISGLTPETRARLLALCAGRRDREGRLVVTSQRTRDQRRNLDDAREKVREVVARALRGPTRSGVPRGRAPGRGSSGWRASVATRRASARGRPCGREED